MWRSRWRGATDTENDNARGRTPEDRAGDLRGQPPERRPWGRCRDLGRSAGRLPAIGDQHLCRVVARRGGRPMMEKTRNNKAWFLVLPVLLLVAFSAVISLMTVVNYSVQATLGTTAFFWAATD